MGTKDVIVKQMPIGYRFLPTDEELVKYYLANKVLGKAIPADVIKDIHASELYSKSPKNTDALSQQAFKWFALKVMMNPNREKEWYFFIHKDEYFHGERKKIPVLENGKSYWSSIGGEEKICDSKGDVLAFKLHFVYCCGKLHDQPKKSNWYMEKYRIQSMPQNTNNLETNECVLARLHKGVNNTYNFLCFDNSNYYC